MLWTHKHLQIIDLNAEISPTLAKTITLTGAAATNDRCMVLADGFENASGLARTYVLTLTNQSDCNENLRGVLFAGRAIRAATLRP